MQTFRNKSPAELQSSATNSSLDESSPRPADTSTVTAKINRDRCYFLLRGVTEPDTHSGHRPTPSNNPIPGLSFFFSSLKSASHRVQLITNSFICPKRKSSIVQRLMSTAVFFFVMWTRKRSENVKHRSGIPVECLADYAQSPTKSVLLLR